MRVIRRKDRLHALRGALREAERHLIADETVCVKLYQRVGAVSLFRQEGRKHVTIARYTWSTNGARP